MSNAQSMHYLYNNNNNNDNNNNNNNNDNNNLKVGSWVGVCNVGMGGEFESWIKG